MYMELTNVQKSYGDEVILKEINLDIPKGQLFGLLGPSGSGKTTLVKIMIGLLEVTSGKVLVEGMQLPNLNLLKKFGYMAQSDALYKDLNARQNLAFFASIYGIPRKQQKKRIAKAAQVVDLTNELDKKLELYSGGMLRRISLAIAILHEPGLLILDEPTVGIDPILRASIWKELKKLQEKGTTIIVTTHVMDEAEKCDELALLRDGHVIAQGSAETLKAESGKQSLEEAFLYYGEE